MDYGKVIFNAGHKNGANVDPRFPNYSEGTAMHNLSMTLHNDTGAPVTRGPDERPALDERARRAKELGAGTYVSLHTNYPTLGTIVYYSIKRPGDKALAEEVGYKVAQALGIKFRGAVTKVDAKGNDWYGDLRYSTALGIAHALLVEHGAHCELAVDTENKLQRIAQVYESIFFNVKNIKEEEGMLIVIPHGIPDVGAAQEIASCKKGGMLDWGLVAPTDDVIVVGGPKDAQPQKPCKSFRVITGSCREATVENVCTFIRTGVIRTDL